MSVGGGGGGGAVSAAVVAADGPEHDAAAAAAAAYLNVNSTAVADAATLAGAGAVSASQDIGAVDADRYLTNDEIERLSFKKLSFKDTIWSTLEALGRTLDIRIGVYRFENPRANESGKRKSVNKTKALVRYIQKAQYWLTHPDVLASIQQYRNRKAAS